MDLIIKKWGNSLGVRIPKRIAKIGKLTENQTVSIEVIKEQVVITPKPPTYSLQELLEKCPSESLILDAEDRAWLDDKPVGKEIL